MHATETLAGCQGHVHQEKDSACWWCEKESDEEGCCMMTFELCFNVLTIGVLRVRDTCKETKAGFLLPWTCKVGTHRAV